MTEGHTNKNVGKTRKLLATTAVAALTALTATVPALAATPPVFPNNIVIFPERDFITLEGYEAKAGQEVTVTVKRGDEITGQAQGLVGDGDPSLEVNHPGGLCWGVGSASFRQVTPNIKPGDVVTATFGDNPATAAVEATSEDSATTLSGKVVDNPAIAGNGFEKVGSNQLIVRGTLGPDVNPAMMEQRIVNPDLKNTAVGRRDVRAPGRPGPYTATLNTNTTAGTFVATYTFRDTQSTPNIDEGNQMRNIAAQGQMRVLSWQAEDADANRQGLTISEFGEAGGPGLGGCPQGPEVQAPDAPTGVTSTGGEGFVTANWTSSHVIPDAPDVLRYLVTAVNVSSGLETSVRVPATATSGTVPGLTAGDYTVEVVAVSSAGRSVAGTSGPVVVAGAPAPTSPTIGTAAQGAANPSPISATANWSAAATQPTGVVVEGYRITAYNATTNVRIKSVFVDAPASSKEVTFTSTQAPSGTLVYFKVQAIDSNGTFSAQSAQSNSVAAR